MEEYTNINDVSTLKKIINDLLKQNEIINNELNIIKSKNKLRCKKYYEENKDKIIKKNNEKRKNLSKEKKNEYQRRWYHNKKRKEKLLKDNSTI